MNNESKFVLTIEKEKKIHRRNGEKNIRPNFKSRIYFSSDFRSPTQTHESIYSATALRPIVPFPDPQAHRYFMHYIRFVKFPHVERDRAKPSCPLTVSALVTVETDLGEAFLSQDVTLQASFRADNPERTLLASQKVSWKKGLRLVKLQMAFEAKSNTNGILCVSASERRADDLRKEVFPDGILSIWSPPLPFDGVADKSYVERKLIVADSKVVSIWEETGQSIARHIWLLHSILQTNIVSYW